MIVEALRNTVGVLRTTEMPENTKGLGHCTEVQEDCKKMLLGWGMPVGQVESRKVQEGCVVVLHRPRGVEEQVVSIQRPEDCIRVPDGCGKTLLGPHTVETEQLHRKEQQVGHRRLELLLGHHRLHQHRECESEHRRVRGHVRDRGCGRDVHDVRVHPLYKREKVI